MENLTEGDFACWDKTLEFNFVGNWEATKGF